jgi:hypothetical protein
MNDRIIEQDQERAQIFFARKDTATTIEKYAHELDWELRQDMTKLATYVWCREQGVDPRFAHMRACRRTPGVTNMDRQFGISYGKYMHGMGRNLDKIVRIAQKAGISTQGKFYVGGLGRYNDPAAWCSSAEDVFTAAKVKKLNLSGPLNFQGASDAPPPAKRTTDLAPDIMQGLVKRYVKDDPGLAERIKNPRQMRKLKEQIVAKHAKKPVER